MVAYENMTVPELKERLKKRGLPVSGNKNELITRLRSKKSVVPTNVINVELYASIREKVRKRVKAWPSAYASGQVVTEYKKAGGRYKGAKGATSLGRWYKEKWVNVCKLQGKGFAPCGREKSKVSKYPYCRPTVRVSSATPMTVGEIQKRWGKGKLQELCKKKRSTALPKKGVAQRISKP